MCDNNFSSRLDAEKLLKNSRDGSWLFRVSRFNKNINACKFEILYPREQQRIETITSKLGSTGVMEEVFGESVAYAFSVKTEDKVLHKLIIHNKYGFLSTHPVGPGFGVTKLYESFDDLLTAYNLDKRLQL